MITRNFLLFAFYWTIVVKAFGQEATSVQDRVESFRMRIGTADNDSLDALYELCKQPEIVEHLVPELTKLLANGSEPARRLAFRCVGQVGEKAKPAVAALVANLDHRDYLIRLELAQTLTAIGPIALPELNEALKSPSAKVRAAALSIIDRLATVEPESLDILQNDPDPRVRIAVAQAWKKHGRLGVEQIVKLLKDQDSVVVSGAAQSLCFHYEDTALSVRHLSESLSRKDSGYLAATALESLGVDAQIAIPKLIRSYPLGLPERFSRNPHKDLVQQALERIGPPRLADLNSLRQLLSDANPSIRAIAAKAIGQLGTDAAEAASDLKTFCLSSAVEHKKIIEQASTIKNELEHDRYLWKNDGHEESAEAACAAYWQVSRNTERFVQLIEELAACWNAEVFFEDGSFAEFSEQDIPFLLKMFESADQNVRESAAFAFYDIPKKKFSMEQLGKIRNAGYLDGKTLAGIRWELEKFHGESLLPWLLEDFEKKELELHELAKIVGSLKIRDPRVDGILNKGLDSKDHFSPNVSSIALAAVAVDEEKAADILLANAERNKRFRRSSLEGLLNQRKPSESAISFATNCLSDSDVWVRRYSISLLARIGPPATESIPAIKELMSRLSKKGEEESDKDTILRIVIAETCISRDKSEFLRRLELAMEDQTEDGWRERSRILNLIEELGPEGDFFMDEISRIIRHASANRKTDQFMVEHGMSVLAIIGSPRAIELLKSFQTDRDWQIQLKAKRLLRLIEEGVELNYNTYVD